MSTTVTESGEEECVPLFMVAIGVPLMFSSTFEVPLDRATFTSRHSLDMNFLSCDKRCVVGVTTIRFQNLLLKASQNLSPYTFGRFSQESELCFIEI